MSAPCTKRVRIKIGLFFLFAATGLFAESYVHGIIDNSVRWKVEHSPYIIDGDLLIKRFGHLTIDPGVQVLIAKKSHDDGAIVQLDNIDSGTIAIKVEGVLTCIGKKNARTSFRLQTMANDNPGWYGIVLDKAIGRFTEIAFTDISGAYYGITVRSCKPLIRNSILERNVIGINCLAGGACKVFNCVITGNQAAGIRVQSADPQIANSIIVANRNNGLWGDNTSTIKFEYNCIFGNSDGDFLDCDPRLGRKVKINKKKDSVDFSFNMQTDPVFGGSLADSMAFARDTRVPTEKAKIKNQEIATIVHDKVDSNVTKRYREKKWLRFGLSRYSPCVNAGNPADRFKDVNGTVNDIGIYGGPEKFERGEEERRN